jgi:predicted nucleotidyltransferase
MTLIEQHQEAIEALCKKHAVRSMYVFGSVLHNNDKPQSDVDLLVEFDWERKRNFSDCYWELKTELESLLNREVDLVCDSAIRNPIFRREVDTHKEPIYAA